MSEKNLPPAPEGYLWELDLYSDKEEWILVKNHVIDPKEVEERNLSKFHTLLGFISYNRAGTFNLTNWEGLKTWENIPQTTAAKPRALTFYSTDPSSALTHSILENPLILNDVDIFYLKNSFQTIMIRTSDELQDFVRKFQNPTFVTSVRGADYQQFLVALCTMETYEEMTYTEPSDLFKVTKIQWKKVQDAGFYGWFIDPSLHEEAMQYQWYRQMGSPMGFVWDIRAFPNPTEDLIRIPFD